MVELREYLDPDGLSHFGEWFHRLNSDAARRVTSALYRLRLENFSNVKGLGSGVFEYRVNFGPGYRVYFGKDGDRLVILLCGGTKKKQQQDIEDAKSYWQDYKARKRSNPWR